MSNRTFAALLQARIVTTVLLGELLHLARKRLKVKR